MLKQQLISFFSRLLLFCCTVGAVDQLLGMLLRKAYFAQPQGFDYQCTEAIRYTRAGTLVLGSSRALNIIDPLVIREKLGDSCFNAGMEGQSVLYHFAVLQAASARYTPQRVILCVDAGGLTNDRKSYDRLSRLLPYYHDHPAIRETIALRGGWEKIKILSGIYPFNSRILDILRGITRQNMAETGRDGYIGLKRTVTAPPPVMDYRSPSAPDTVKVNRLQMLLSHCRNAGIKLYIVCPPYRVISTGADTSLSITRRLAAAEGVPFLDFSTDTSWMQHEGWFADFRHLNSVAAPVFTDSVAARIRLLELQESRR